MLSRVPLLYYTAACHYILQYLKYTTFIITSYLGASCVVTCAHIITWQRTSIFFNIWNTLHLFKFHILEPVVLSHGHNYYMAAFHYIRQYLKCITFIKNSFLEGSCVIYATVITRQFTTKFINIWNALHLFKFHIWSQLCCHVCHYYIIWKRTTIFVNIWNLFIYIFIYLYNFYRGWHNKLR